MSKLYPNVQFFAFCDVIPMKQGKKFCWMRLQNLFMLVMKERKKDGQEGIEEGKIQLIRGMHKNGMPIEDIAKFTNLRIEDIRNILQT